MVIFGTGVVTGGLLVRYTGVHGPHPHTAAQVRPAQFTSPMGMRVDFLRRVGRELNLTPEQRERVDRILRESQERSKKIMEPVSPQLREVVRKTRAEFVEVLTPEQKARFNELVRQQQRPREQQRPQGFREPTLEGAPTSTPPAAESQPH